MSRKKGKQHRKHKPRGLPRTPAVNLEEIAAIVERTKAMLSAQDHEKLKAAINTLASSLEIVTELIAQLHSKEISVERLRRMVFGSRTEKTEAVLARADPDSTPPSTPTQPPEEPPDPDPKPGHGRFGAAAYAGAEQISVPHPTLHGGEACPACEKGKVYRLAEPATRVRITGMAPLGARVYACDRLRCNLCGEVYTADSPPGVGEQKYDASASSMVGLLKYGTRTPFNRIEKLQEAMRIPMPAATQWELVERAAPDLAPAHEELIRQGAQAEVVYNDDTTMKVLQLTREQRAAALGEDADEQRTGVFTSGIVATAQGHQIALFFTGVRHAGENLAEVLKRRAAELPAPIQMCDGLSSNTAGDFESVLAGCNAHARRRYTEVAESFPQEVRFVLETLREVYKTDARARALGLSPKERLELHQHESAPRMKALEEWMPAQFEQRLVEPNSTLGEAIRYMQKHWDPLTLFLRKEGAPLDNNITERALKKAILHRKNALFYKTLNGARVGDIFMGLIYTAELNGVAPFDYLVALQRHAKQVNESPGEWMPWNYQQTLARQNAGPDPPPQG